MSGIIVINHRSHSFAVVLLPLTVQVIFILVIKYFYIIALLLKDLNASLTPAALETCLLATCSPLLVKENSIILPVTNVSLVPHSQMCTAYCSTCASHSVTWKGHESYDCE